jgi:hypothetical protein
VTARPWRDPGEQFRLQIVAHQPVVTAEGDGRTRQRAALAQVQRGEVERRGPSFGVPVQLGHLALAEGDAGRAQQRRRLCGAEHEVRGADFGEPGLGAQPREPQRRLGPARQYQV